MKLKIITVIIIVLGITLGAQAAQQTVNLPALTVSADGVEAVQNWMLNQSTGASTTVAIAMLASDLTMTVSDGTVLSANQLVSIEGEGVKISSVTGNVATIVRGVVGTTPAAHNTTVTVQCLKYPSINAVFKQVIADAMGRIMDAAPSAAIKTQQAAIATATGAITATKSGAVQ